MSPDATEKRICKWCGMEKTEAEMEKGYSSRPSKRCKKCISDYQKERRAVNLSRWENNDPYTCHPTGIKRCGRCKKEKSIQEFGYGRDEFDGLCKMCRTCTVDYWQERKYGKISSGKDRCEICGGESNNQGMSRLCIDHNHITGQSRGKLCALCNSGIGQFRDSAKLVAKALKYLKKYELR